MRATLSPPSESDHADSPRRIESRILASLPSIEVTVREGTLSEPASRLLSLPQGRFFVALARRGAVLFESLPGRSREVLAQGGAVFLVGPVNVTLQYGRGHQDWVELEWSRSANRAMADWLGRSGSLSESGSLVRGRSLASVEGRSGSMVSHLTRVLSFPPTAVEPALWSLLWDVVSEVVTSEVEHPFASIPPETPPILASLAEDVRSDPTRSWTLREAAQVAGYSPFHLSRTFRTFLEYGFPSYVERCRVENALGRVLRTATPFEELSRACGFGSAQSMRDAFREVVGFLPSELRSVPVATA